VERIAEYSGGVTYLGFFSIPLDALEIPILLIDTLSSIPRDALRGAHVIHKRILRTKYASINIMDTANMRYSQAYSVYKIRIV
jgi:hypothetical protein